MCGLWNAIKNAGSSIKRGVKQGAKWAWDNRESIGKAIGTGLDVAATLGVPGANVASKVVKNVSNIGKAFGEDKFSKGFESTLKKDKSKRDNDSNNSSLPISQPSSGGYSVSTRNSGGTKEGIRVNSWKH